MFDFSHFETCISLLSVNIQKYCFYFLVGNLFSTFFGPLAGLLVFLFVFLVVCNMYISRNCPPSRTKSIRISTVENFQPHESANNEQNNSYIQQDDPCENGGYQTIDEAAMIPHLASSCTLKGVTNVDVHTNMILNEDMPSSSASSSRTSANLYLDVVDDDIYYRRSYEKVLLRDINEHVYTYSHEYIQQGAYANKEFDSLQNEKSPYIYKLCLSLDRRQAFKKNDRLKTMNQLSRRNHSCPELIVTTTDSVF